MGCDTDYDDMIEEFTKLNAEVKAAMQRMYDQTQTLVEAAAGRLLDSTPEIEQVHWVQYTPYFNDGDACTFDVGEICFKLIRSEDDDEDFSFYESDPISTSENLRAARDDYTAAALYESDKDAWVTGYTERYKDKLGHEYPGQLENLKPYPSSTAQAQRNIDEVEKQIAWYPAGVSDRIAANFKAFCDVLSLIPDDSMESVFGDHASVVINRNGVEIDEHLHD